MPAGPDWSLDLGLGLGLLLQNPAELFCFQELLPGLSFQGGEKPRGAEEPLVLLGS